MEFNNIPKWDAKKMQKFSKTDTKKILAYITYDLANLGYLSKSGTELLNSFKDYDELLIQNDTIDEIQDTLNSCLNDFFEDGEVI